MLAAMGAVPAGFRLSTLSQLLEQGKVFSQQLSVVSSVVQQHNWDEIFIALLSLVICSGCIWPVK